MEDKEVFEWNVLIALFKATQEQTSHLNGKTRHEAKVIFKKWQRQGELLLRIIERIGDDEKLEEITSHIEDSIHVLRKEIEIK